MRRWSALDQDFSPWRDRYREISDSILPVSGRFLSNERNRGDKVFNSIYDSAGTRALGTLSAGLMAGMTSPARPWFRLSTPDPALMKFEPVKLWLHEVTRIMQSVFARSNTYRSLHSMYEELGAYGTAATIMLDDFDNVIHHFTLTAGEYRLATNYKGEVDCLYRQFQKTVAELVKEFGIGNVSTTVKDLFTRGNLDAYVEVVHLVEPREDRDVTKRDPLNMRWKSVYFEKGRDEDKYLRESGFKNFRVLAPRWTTYGGDTYGTSPAMMAIGDVRQLQHQQLRKAQGIDYQVKPPLVMPTSAKNNPANFMPGGVTYADTTNPQGVRSAWDVNINMSYLLEDIKDVRERIDATFYTDLFRMLANTDRRQMTATEVAERHEERLLLLGPVLERQHNELLSPKVEMTFDRIVEAGMVPPPPPELEGADLDVEFVSMLAQAQRAIGTNGIDRFVMSLGQIAAVKPDVLDKLNADEWADVYSDMLGVDPALIVADKDVAIIRKQRAEAQAQMQQAAMAEQAAGAAQKLGSVDTSQPNALTDVTRMFSGYT